MGNGPRCIVNTVNGKNPLNSLPVTFFYKKA